jgi:hypothetical protein
MDAREQFQKEAIAAYRRHVEQFLELLLALMMLLSQPPRTPELLSLR